MLKNILILIMVIFSFVKSFDNPWRFIYENDGSLARHQESLLIKYKQGEKISNYELRTLKINEWVRTAYKLAPGNLIIRQYCIIDLFEGTPKHKDKINHLVHTISGGKSPFKYRTWAEGYTYWLYTKDALNPWMKKFEDDSVVKEIYQMGSDVDSGFALTAFRRDGEWWPAPFGDLWEVALDSLGQVRANSFCCLDDTVSLKNLTRYLHEENNVYVINPMPMGLNGHCETKRSIRFIYNGKPDNFQYYQGYDKKYHDVKAEWTDLLNPVRLLTIPFIW